MLVSSDDMMSEFISRMLLWFIRLLAQSVESDDMRLAFGFDLIFVFAMTIVAVRFRKADF